MSLKGVYRANNPNCPCGGSGYRNGGFTGGVPRFKCRECGEFYRGNGTSEGLERLMTAGFYGDGRFPEFEDEMRRVSLSRPRRIPDECIALRIAITARSGFTDSLWFVSKALQKPLSIEAVS